MLELAVFTDDIDQDLTHALDIAKELGTRWVEIRSAWGTSLLEHGEERLREMREAVRARDLRIPCVSARLFMSPLAAGPAGSPAEAELGELLQRAIRVAQVFGTDRVRCFSFRRVRGGLAGALPALRARFEEALEIARQAGITLLLKNDAACNVATGAEAARCLDELASPNLRLLWDPGNAYAAGEIAYPAGYRRVKDLVAHVHVKDAARDPTTNRVHWMPMGTGELDLRGQLRALGADGYQGVVTLENHYTPPGGTREDGVRASFRGLKQLLDQSA